MTSRRLLTPLAALLLLERRQGYSFVVVPSERRLCALFGVGRTTVREALKALAAQGYVAQSRRGAVVIEPSHAPQPEIDLEALAARTTIRPSARRY